MNLSSFQLLKEDGDSYEIKHPKGKTLRIPKAGLSEKSHAAIKAMGPLTASDGVEVEDTSEPNRSPASVPVPEDNAPAQSQGIGANLPSWATTPVSQQVSAAINDQTPEMSKENVQAALADPNSPFARDYPDQLAKYAQFYGLQGGPAPASIAPPSAAPAQTLGQPAPGQQPQQPNPFAQNNLNMNSLLDQSEKDIENFSKQSQAAVGQASQAWKDYNDQVGKMQSPMDIAAAYKAKDDQLAQAVMQNKIDPHRFWNDKSTGSKIAAGIGVILGGMGAGLTHGPNMALGVIQSAIDRDIEAQKNDQSKNMNLWRMNREAMGDDMRANLATQNQMLSVAQAKAAQATAGMNNAQAVLRSREMINQIEQQKLQNNFRMGLLTQKANGQQPGNGVKPIHLGIAGLIPMEQAQKEQAAYDGYGQNVQALNNIYDQLEKLSGPGSRASSPIQSGKQIDALHAQAASIIQAANPSERLTPESAKLEIEPYLAGGMTGSHATWQKLRQGAMQHLALKYADQFPGTSTYAPGAVPKYQDQVPPETKTVNGVTYIRGPDGKTAIPVK